MYGDGCLCPEDKVNMTSPVRIGTTSNIPANVVTCLSVEWGFSVLPVRIISSQVLNANSINLWRTLTRDNGAAIIYAGNLCAFSACVQYECHIGFTQASNKTVGNQRTERKLNSREPDPSAG